MTELKCPFCGEKLQQTYSFNPKQFWCSNYYDHKHPINLQGTKELWQELIRARKALDVAVEALKLISLRYLCEYADKALDQIKQITALEQKD